MGESGLNPLIFDFKTKIMYLVTLERHTTL